MTHPDAARLRAQLDATDDALLARLEERAELAQRLAALGGSTDADVTSRTVLRRGPLSPQTVALLFRELSSACRAKPLSVACLGPTGTFSELAAQAHFGRAARLELTASIDEVFRAVEAGGVEFGVVPVENSTDGAVGRSLDLLAQTTRHVCGEVSVRIRHQLLARDPAIALGSVTHVYSHAQSLAQCQAWLSAHLPRAERVAVSSNAEAARRAAADGVLAIAGEHAASTYELGIVARDIEDDPDNTTRFVVLGNACPPSTGRDRTSLVVSARNQPGAVYALLQPLAARAVSMTRFESRPSRVALWEYLFFVDVDGHRDDPHVAAALEELSAIAGWVKILGSYPKASV